MDLLSEAIAHKGMEFVLVACDTDFVPIIKEIKEKFLIKVNLYYFNDFVRNSKFSMSNYIMTACDKCILITKEAVLKSQLIKNENKDEKDNHLASP